jgi:hypothetical protein
VEQLKRRRYSQRSQKTLEEGVKKKKPQKIQEHEKVEAIPALEEEVSNIQYLEIEPHTELVGEDNKITKPEVVDRSIGSYIG